MKTLKSLFLVLALTVLVYSASEAGAQELYQDQTGDTVGYHSCCQYQVDCPTEYVCKYVSPPCSEYVPNACVKRTVSDVEQK